MTFIIGKLNLSFTLVCIIDNKRDFNVIIYVYVYVFIL